MFLKQITRIIISQNRKNIVNDCIRRGFITTKWLKTEILTEKNNHAANTNFNQIINLDENKSTKSYTTIDGKSHKVTNYMVSVKSKSKRDKSKMMLLEGKRLIQDGLDAGMQPLALFFSRLSDIADFKLDKNVELFKIPYKNLQFWSDVSTTQGVLAIFPIPDSVDFSFSFKLPLTIICDNIRDPGNMGSILRTCAAVGCSQILLTKGCVDLWDPKVLRSAAGAHFRLNIKQSILWDEMMNFIPERSEILLADSDIPEPETTTNVYELKDGQKVPVQEEEKRKTSFQKNRQNSNLPLEPYTNINFKKNNLVLIIGGETQGLSKEAYNFGTGRIFVPMANGIESLNSGTALGIIAYEIRRQILS